jgi:hypothetical protein
MIATKHAAALANEDPAARCAGGTPGAARRASWPPCRNQEAEDSSSAFSFPWLKPGLGETSSPAGASCHMIPVLRPLIIRNRPGGR